MLRIIVGCLVLVACGCNDDEGGRKPGREGAPCRAAQACDPGLECVQGLCVRAAPRDLGPATDGDGPGRDAPAPDGAPAACSPACAGGSCCAGECVELASDAEHCGRCGTACAGSDRCVAGRCVACTPRCAASDPCGADGCGGSCGSCGAGQRCDPASGACTACAAFPICGARVCGDDGCGRSCGSCAAGERCVDGRCAPAPAPSCAGQRCGDADGAGGICQTGACPGGGQCAAGRCDASCRPDCAGKACGNDGCGGRCGLCAAGLTCSSAGQCECSPWCSAEGRECGPDGCGGSCGACAAAPKTHCSPRAICTADPGVVGCSDATAEGFADKAAHPQISACQGAFPEQSLRTARTGAPCGNDLGGCQVPEDLCASGWHLCMKNGWPADLRDRLAPGDCSAAVAGAARFVGGSSQSAGANDCTAPLPCNVNYAVCCGSGCVADADDRNDCVWPDQTPWFPYGSCVARSSVDDGVLCCKDPELVGP